ncbi:MAG: hypothetical protein JSW53_04920 [Candidatus Bathyarchaeota archaeon]|nr:MAG: hypothetical protein JSW53_04920 [Candidatus Bathyarchaeota archaeon]
MSSVLSIPKIWDLLKSFKELCQSRGWKISEHEDWIRTNDDYHNFLWIQTIHPSTFEKVAINQKCAIQHGVSYRVVDVSYTAWLFPRAPPEGLIDWIANSPELSKKTAIYDLSWAYEGKPVCVKLNMTASPVFQEFENFLEDRCGVKLKPLHQVRGG